MAEEMLVDRTVIVDRYSWITAGPVPGSPSVWHQAVKGDVVSVSRDEADRGEALGGLGSPDDLVAQRERAAAEALGFGASDTELGSMTAEQLADYVGSHPAEAQRVVTLELARERPRKSVLAMAPSPAGSSTP